MIAKNPSKPIKNLEKTALTSTNPGSEMLSQSQWAVTAQTLRLTRREKQVCQKLFEGITRNEIAEHLGIKPRTVRHYMEHIHEKLEVSNRVGVVLRIIQMRDQMDEVGELRQEPKTTLENRGSAFRNVNLSTAKPSA